MQNIWRFKKKLYLCNRNRKTKHRGVEQLVARWAHNPKVVCSSQASATKKGSKRLGIIFYSLSYSF